jgi:hypothetical protein
LVSAPLWYGRSLQGVRTSAPNLRSRTEVERFFTGFELVEPGVAQVPFWRPDVPPPAGSDEIGFYGGVARRTG